MRLVTSNAPLVRVAGLVAAVILLSIADGRDALGQVVRDHRSSAVALEKCKSTATSCRRRCAVDVLFSPSWAYNCKKACDSKERSCLSTARILNR